MNKLEKTIHTEEYRMLLERLKNRRQKLKISQEKLSKLLGRTRTFVSKVELGEHRLDVIELMRYLEALRLDPKKFFCDYCNAGLGGKSPEIGRKSLKFSGKKFWPTVKILDLAGKNLQPIQLIFD